MLSNTSGLRDWGRLKASRAGRARRANTPAHVLEIVSRQRAGTSIRDPGGRTAKPASISPRSSCRGSAESPLPVFEAAHFCAARHDTQRHWRDDHTRIVKNRAIAYSEADGGYTIEMPFENVTATAVC